MKTPATSLPLIADCNGCGVCCFHMGYPPFIRPQAPMTAAEIDANPELLAKISRDPLLRRDLEQGRTGEHWWHVLPDDLRHELDMYVAGYQARTYDDEVSSFDGPCCWFDMETRRCQHHEHRPNVCRDFETGSQPCYEWRNFYRDRIKPIESKLNLEVDNW